MKHKKETKLLFPVTEMSVSQIFFISCGKMWVKIITKMAFKEKYVGGVDWWRDADVCLF